MGRAQHAEIAKDLAEQIASGTVPVGELLPTEFELCERYGASIDFRSRPAGEPHANEFFVVMRRMPLTDTEARLQLTP